MIPPSKGLSLGAESLSAVEFLVVSEGGISGVGTRMPLFDGHRHLRAVSLRVGLQTVRGRAVLPSRAQVISRGSAPVMTLGRMTLELRGIHVYGEVDLNARIQCNLSLGWGGGHWISLLIPRMLRSSLRRRTT